MKRLAKDKHSSSLETFANYGRKIFYNIGPWMVNMSKPATCKE